jgi:Rad3-related DNA helicase
MFMDLGRSLARIAEITPGGILMFFPSYRVMEQCYDHWQDSGIIQEIERNKLLLKEPKNSS